MSFSKWINCIRWGDLSSERIPELAKFILWENALFRWIKEFKPQRIRFRLRCSLEVNHFLPGAFAVPTKFMCKLFCSPIYPIEIHLPMQVHWWELSDVPDARWNAIRRRTIAPCAITDETIPAFGLRGVCVCKYAHAQIKYRNINFSHVFAPACSIYSIQFPDAYKCPCLRSHLILFIY